jgi:hypothetical protein
MEAHLARWAILLAAFASLGASYRTPNFIVEAPSAQMAQQIGQAAETFRRDLAKEWLGTTMPNWAQPCPITAQVGDHLGAGGATSFVFEHGEVYGWRMSIQGSLVRILDSVLPHEVTHTIFATHFRRPLPRWADEGACTTVEHPSEKSKQQMMLIDFLHTNRGIAFNRMFAMKEYPQDVMPLYSQGYSVARYLVAQGGKRKFLAFLGEGMADEKWSQATNKYYGIPSLDALQNNWLAWVRQGSPNIATPDESQNLVAISMPAATAVGQPSDDDARPRSEAYAPNSPVVQPATADVPSVYELASTRKNAAAVKAKPRSEQPALRSPRPAPSDVASTDHPSSLQVGPADGDGAAPVTSHQSTRPQPVQRPRQVILEWNRPPGDRGLSESAMVNYPGPIDESGAR